MSTLLNRPSKEELIDLYFTQSRSLRWLKNHYKVYKPTISKWLREYKLDHLKTKEQISKQREVTNLLRYGSKSSFSNSEVQNKFKQTCLRKYNVDNPLKVPKIKDKVFKTHREKALLEGHYQGKHLPSNTRIIISSCTKFRDYIVNLPKNERFIYGISNRLKTSPSYTLYLINHYNCRDLIEFYPHTSWPQKCLRSFLEQRYPDLKLLNNVRTIIKSPNNTNLELDLYDPHYKIAFEYNSLQYHKNKPSGYHHYKTLACKRKHIRLFHIWESDYDTHTQEFSLELLHKIDKYIRKIRRKLNEGGDAL